MKLVVVRHSLLSRGGDKMIVAHASHLAAQGHEVSIRTNVVDTVYRLHPLVRVEPLTFSGKLGTLLSALCEKHDADTVVADIIPLACLLWFRNRGKVLFFAQGYDASCYTTMLQKGFIHFLYLLGLSLFKVRAVAVSQGVAQLLSRYAGSAVTVVENGVDTAAFYPEPDPELVSGKEGRRAVVLMARRDPSKGYDLGISVMRNLQARMPDAFEVWTVGDGTAGDFAGMRHRDLGYLDEGRLRRVLSSADLMLYPSRSEGFPLMVLEAFACRCPVVTTDAVPYARHGENSLVARIGDVELLTRYTMDMLGSPCDAAKLAEEGYRLARERSLQRSLHEFESRLQGEGKTLSPKGAL